MVVSTSEDSCGLALPGDSAMSRPFASQMAMILLPFPFLVSPTRFPFFSRGKGGINESLVRIDQSTFHGQRQSILIKLVDKAGIYPFLISAVGRLICAIFNGQILPACSCPGQPHHPIENWTIIFSGPPKYPARLIVYPENRACPNSADFTIAQRSPPSHPYGPLIEPAEILHQTVAKQPDGHDFPDEYRRFSQHHLPDDANLPGPVANSGCLSE